MTQKICSYTPPTAATANHSLEIGYRTMLVDDACRGVAPEDISNTKQSILDNHGMVINSSQVSGNIDLKEVI